MSSKILLVCIAAALIAIPALAQEQPPAQAEKVLTGCLNAADQQGQFVLTVKEGGSKGEKVTVVGAADLEKHAKNHTVKLTGTMAKEGGKDVLKVSKIEHVEATCQAATE
ncbi:MAG: hypothetical protein ACRD21_05705 [Vicinamibacteria bacterium]